MSLSTASVSPAASVIKFNHFSLQRVLIVGVLLSAILNVLFVPVFATQDGPLHSFYSQVFLKLLQGDPIYTAQYHVKSIFPPYSAHLYLLIFVNWLTGNQYLTERIIAALAILCTFVGFARLSWAINKTSMLPLAMCLPFMANWSLYMGFFNFTFGLAILMFAAGYWLDHAGEQFGVKEFFVTACLTFLLAAMHPMALAFFYLTAGLYLVFLVVDLRRYQPATYWRQIPRRFGSPALFLFCSALVTYIWGRQFVDHNRLLIPVPTLRDIAERIFSFFSMNEISPFTFTVWYTLPLLCVFVPCLLFASKGVKERWRDPRVATIATVALGCFLLFLVVPKEFNTAYHFHRRFSLFSLLLTLALAGSWYATPVIWRRMSLVAIATGCVAIVAQHWGSQAIVKDIQPVLQAPALPTGSRIVEVRFGSYRYGKPLRFAPSMWAAAYWSTESHATIMNMPWATQPYYPIQSNHEPDREPIDFAPLFEDAIRHHAPLPLQPNAIVVEMAVDNVPVQNRAVQALEQQYGFHALPSTSPDLTLLVRNGVRP